MHRFALGLVKSSLFAAALLATVAPHLAAQDPGDVLTHTERRDAFMAAMDGGIALVVSSKKDQDFLYEFFVPHSDNHDFIFLTGLDAIDSWESAVVFAPGADTYRQILYTSMDPSEAKRRTGFSHVFPYALLGEHLSNALTDFSLMRTHQRGSKPVSTDLARALGDRKIVYFNFQRFLNLDDTPPERLELARRLRDFSPEVELRDATDILNGLRMIHDDLGKELLRRASAITVDAFMESARAVRPGKTTGQIGAVVEFVFAHNHATPSFRTNVRISGPRPSERPTRPDWPIGWNDRLGPWEVHEGDMISYDIGAEYGHYTSDFGRSIPVSGRYTPEQRRLAEVMNRVQRQLIAAVRPGGSFRQNQELKDRLVAEAGLADRTTPYGISHFVGMEIHDVGDYDIPFEPGMCFVIEWSVAMDDFSIRFEDVILVTEDGHEWLTEAAPMDPDDIEALMAEAGVYEDVR